MIGCTLTKKYSYILVLKLGEWFSYMSSTFLYTNIISRGRVKLKKFYSLNQSVLTHLLSKILAFLAFVAFKGLKRPKKAEKKTFAK